MFDLNMSPIDYAKLQRKVSLEHAMWDLQTKSGDEWDMKVNTDILIAWHEQEIAKAFEEGRISEHGKQTN